ncbi:MAG: amidohydrolase/deacetylase family metallohydrolase [Candidatus Latescibacteria bacterium]|nr:amidohydrolase/deacetylase family metallohydrolase [Candidatus Latescibacterota bacterium]
MYDLILSGATVIDPAQGINEVREVAIAQGKIAAVEPRIEGPARERIDLSGLILTSGWIDIHAHIYPGATTWGIQADALCLATGVTTIVDAGSAGWANFIGFRDYIAARARTRMLAFVHISGIGLTYGPLGEMEDLRYADPERTAFVIHHWGEVCVGVKVRQGAFQVGPNGVEPLRLAVKAAELAGVPIMVHIGAGVPLPRILELLRSGDIVTHCYQGNGDGILGEKGEVLEQVRQARDRGVVFDLGHGGGSFRYEVAKQALAQGFASDAISTDWHAHSLEDPVFSLPETGSKLLNLGVELEEIVRQTTSAPAAAIGRSGELGSLQVGRVADLAALVVREGEFSFVDVHGQREQGRLRIDPVMTMRAGKVYWPDDLRAELEEARQRARQIRALTGKNFAALGWKPET